MEHEIISENYIDVRKILAAKGVKLPAFAVWLLGRLLHVKDLNAGIYNNRDKFGLDFVYDMTDKEILKFKEIEFNDFEILKTGINVSYEFCFDDTSFFIVAGTHLSGKEMSEGYLYQKICAKQNLSKHFFITCSLTTHFGWADFFTMGAGFRIN